MNENEGQNKTGNPVILLIFDGFGVAPSWGGNAITQARMPNYFSALRQMPNTTIEASGEAVGLPDSEEGNSEVGHLNIGTGIVLEQNLKKINKDVDSGHFFSNEILLEAFNRAKIAGKSVNILGMMSHGGVHGDINHLYALLEMAKRVNFKDVKLHLFTDGRDSSPNEAHHYVYELENKITQLGVGNICSLIGRYYALDRDQRWDRTQLAYDLITSGIGTVVNNASTAISEAYKHNFSDEFIPPYAIRDGRTTGIIEDGDSIICYNFREDRVRQLVSALLLPDFKGFVRKKTVKINLFVTFVNYGQEFSTQVAFPSDKAEWPLAKVLANAGKNQLHIAETEKYAHITYFFNGGNETANKGEDWVLVPSQKVQTYDIRPKMSAPEIASKLIEAINTKKYELIVVNFANPDMVGHSGNIKATVEALEYLDTVLEQIFQTAKANNYYVLFTSDHGNCEEIISRKTGEKSTDHTNNKVPFLIISPVEGETIKLRQDGCLADIAPTVLEVMNITKPAQMNGSSLIEK